MNRNDIIHLLILFTTEFILSIETILGLELAGPILSVWTAITVIVFIRIMLNYVVVCEEV